MKLGKPENLTDKSTKKTVEAIKFNARWNVNNQRATGYIKALRKEDESYRNIADILNSEGFTTSRNKKFNAIQVRRLALS